MKAPKRLNADGVRQWLAGQAAAAMVIEKERREWLRRLDSADSLRLYLSLLDLPAGPPLNDRQPSPVLATMREMCALRVARGR